MTESSVGFKNLRNSSLPFILNLPEDHLLTTCFIRFLRTLRFLAFVNEASSKDAVSAEKRCKAVVEAVVTAASLAVDETAATSALALVATLASKLVPDIAPVTTDDGGGMKTTVFNIVTSVFLTLGSAESFVPFEPPLTTDGRLAHMQP